MTKKIYTVYAIEEGNYLAYVRSFISYEKAVKYGEELGLFQITSNTLEE